MAELTNLGTPLTIIFFTGFIHIGHMASVELTVLPVSRAFHPTADRSWLVNFWDLSAREIFLALPFAILLTILFWFDHNVSSLIAQGSEFPLRKPPGFHWDIFLLGLTTGIAGILGIPLPNGLIPQAPFHTQSLCVTKSVAVHDKSGGPTRYERVVTHVVEQRVSNLAQGLLFLVTMTGPLLTVLHLIPQGVLAGLFFVMGIQALMGNGITQKLLFLLSDTELVSPDEPLSRLDRRSAIWAFVGLELLIFGATFAITQIEGAAIGFPVVIIISIPFRTWVMPRWFRPEELRALDGPTASAFVMESVGGAYGEEGGSSTPEEHTRDGKDESAVLDDALERGESYELSEGGHLPSGRAGAPGMRRMTTGSEADRPDIGATRRRMSSRGRAKGGRLD